MENKDLRAAPSVAVIVPCYRVRGNVLGVVLKCLENADAVICVDDACPEESGRYIEENIKDSALTVVYNEKNTGVGGAVKAGYRKAMEMGCSVAVKVDGDGQMDPALIPLFTGPLVNGRSDYTKGNRFTRPEDYRSMPAVRLLGNTVLSLLAKPSTGYWRTLDPTNGYTAISTAVLRLLPLDRVDDRYFFETDMLHHLRNVDALVTDIPMKAVYGGEKSSLSWKRALFEFFFKHLRNAFSRICFQYVIKDFSIATIQLFLGVLLTVFGTVTGIVNWHKSISTGITASAGSVMLAALPVILGLQLLLSFISYDIASVPQVPLSERLEQ